MKNAKVICIVKKIIFIYILWGVIYKKLAIQQ